MSVGILLTVGPLFIPIFLVWLGWYLNEHSRRRQGDRAAVGRALTALLVIHRQFLVASKTKQLMETFLNTQMPPETETALKVLFQTVFPESEITTNEYQYAVSYVAGTDPLLAFKLRLDAQRGNLRHFSETILRAQAPPEVLGFLNLVTEASQLNESILALARMHSRKVSGKVKAYLSDQAEFEIPEEAMRLLEWIKKEATSTKPKRGKIPYRDLVSK